MAADRVVVSPESNVEQSGSEVASNLGTIALAAPAPLIQPSEDGWQTEAFSEAAGAQLKQLGKLMTGKKTLQGRDVAGLLDEGFQCGPLRPSRVDVVFDDGSLVIQRPLARDVAELQRPAKFRGADGLARAITDLVTPEARASDLRCEFKIFRVTMTSAGPATEAHFHRSGRTRLGAFQQTAVWKCQWEQAPSQSQPRLKSISIAQYEEALGRRHEGPLFSDCTEAVLGHNRSYHEQLTYGLDHWLNRFELLYGIFATSYHGLAVGDVNGDGLDDIYLCQPGGLLGGLPNRLFVQEPDGRARDVSEAAGVDWLVETHGALLIDLDNDGDQDLVGATVAGLIFAVNDGQGVFHTKVVKLTPEAPPISLAAADFDNDGDLDIYACCYSRRASSQVMGRPIPYHDANNGGRNVLFRNDRNWQFTNVTKRVGLDQNNHRFSLACVWEDFDNDGDVDLYVANDFGRNNLYLNDAGRFHDSAAQAGVEDISAGMSVSCGDYNNDGWMDLYVSNMWSSAGNRISYQRRFLRAKGDRATLADFQRHARGNSLFANVGSGQSPGFRDVSVSARVTMGRWAWSSRFLDMNNDGWEDVVVVNGYITQEDTSDL